MKNSLKYLIVITLSFFSCQKEEIVTIEDVYQEYVVVQSEIYPNFNFPGVRLTKTLPLGVNYDIKLAEIKNASLYLRIDGIKIIPLHYNLDGLYKPQYDLYVNSGERYELFGQVDDLSFYSETIIPFKPEVNSVLFNGTSFYAEANVTTNPNECYSALWVINQNNFLFPDDFFNVSTIKDSIFANNLNVRTANYPSEYQLNEYNGRRYIQVFSFDKSFENYFKSKGSGSGINNPYVQGIGNTLWNIQGNKVIGMFIGIQKGDILFVN